MKKSGIGWQRSALPSEHNHKKGRPRRGSPDFGLFFPVFPIFLGFLNDLFEGAGGVGALGDIHQELIQLGPHLLVHPKAGVEVLIIPERLDLVLHDGGRVDLGVADALGILDVVVTGFGNGYENIGVQNVFQIENQIFGPAHPRW